MDGRDDDDDANLPATTTTSSSSSPPHFLRNVQAAFKRHRMMPQLKPRRFVVRGEIGNLSDPVVLSSEDSVLGTKRNVNYEDPSMMPPDILCIGNRTTNEGNSMSSFGTGTTSTSFADREHGPLVDGPKKVQFALEKNATSHGFDDYMDTRTDNLLSHMDSLALAEIEFDGTAVSQEMRHQKFQNLEDYLSKNNDEKASLHLKSTVEVEDQINPFRNFIESDFGRNMTQSSIVRSSCATTTLVNPEFAPMLNSTTHCSPPQINSFQAGEYSSVQDQSTTREPNYVNKVLPDRLGSLFPSASIGSHLEKRLEISKGQQDREGYIGMTKDSSHLADRSSKSNTFAGDVTDIQSQAPIADDHFSNVKTGPCKSQKQEKTEANKSTRKRNYDPDLFFKVNGKLYQRLGKIGSGGSSEVHKVISQDCTIYALKKIKLKGRDYGSAYGFCQEIEYLNKLKGRDHIIQLIDYEVTDKALLKEVMSGSVSNKDGKVKDDEYIYMVLEYGEIDLAQMLSHKWKELDKSKLTIDENWLRFYWKQILLAVKTIHEERIVHSDLKPANFLLVRGSLKLIDFGIAKAILSDTTNIQRDSQVGTLSYMSPEAYMCNETDAQGNVIKCGRPSDIWSLGCILYQMVYGRTPFADYKTFWAKFKVVTDPDYEIHYEPLSNPWLLDLMKKCLAWDRNKRWRIPELLEHPFLVPSIPTLEDRRCKLIRIVLDSCNDNPKALLLCTQLEQLLRDPLPDMTTKESILVEKRRASTLLCEMAKLSVQLKEQLET